MSHIVEQVIHDGIGWRIAPPDELTRLGDGIERMLAICDLLPSGLFTLGEVRWLNHLQTKLRFQTTVEHERALHAEVKAIMERALAANEKTA